MQIQQTYWISKQIYTIFCKNIDTQGASGRIGMTFLCMQGSDHYRTRQSTNGTHKWHPIRLKTANCKRCVGWFLQWIREEMRRRKSSKPTSLGPRGYIRWDRPGVWANQSTFLFNGPSAGAIDAESPKIKNETKDKNSWSQNKRFFLPI